MARDRLLEIRYRTIYIGALDAAFCCAVRVVSDVGARALAAHQSCFVAVRFAVFVQALCLERSYAFGRKVRFYFRVTLA